MRNTNAISCWFALDNVATPTIHVLRNILSQQNKFANLSVFEVECHIVIIFGVTLHFGSQRATKFAAPARSAESGIHLTNPIVQQESRLHMSNRAYRTANKVLFLSISFETQKVYMAENHPPDLNKPIFLQCTCQNTHANRQHVCSVRC